MKQYQNLPQMLDAPQAIRNFLALIIKAAQSPFEEALGGDVFLVETDSDLEQVTVDYFSGASILDTAATMDMAQWIDKHETYALFFTATNDGGGPGYFVPRFLVDKYENLQKTMEMTNEPVTKTRAKKSPKL